MGHGETVHSLFCLPFTFPRILPEPPESVCMCMQRGLELELRVRKSL